MTPTLVALAGFLLLVATIELQVRIVEEPYLLTVHGDDYRSYLTNVGRFMPGRGQSLGTCTSCAIDMPSPVSSSAADCVSNTRLRFGDNRIDK